MGMLFSICPITAGSGALPWTTHMLLLLLYRGGCGRNSRSGSSGSSIPSAIFHDVISYPKNHHKRLHSSAESANFAKKVLKKIKSYPKEKIKKVCDSTTLCSFTKAQKPEFLEAKILQDADSLEAMGAVSIMRTFSSAGTMNKLFYDIQDPFCKNRKPDDNKYALDLFFTRLLVVQNRLHTKTAKVMAKKRVVFLKEFLKELKLELTENEKP